MSLLHLEPLLETGKSIPSGFKESGLPTPTSATIATSKDSDYATISEVPNRGDGPTSISPLDVDPAPVRDASSPLPDSPGLEYPDPFEAILERPVAPVFHPIPIPTHGPLLMKHSSEHAAQRTQLLPKISHYRSHPPSFPKTARPLAPKRSIQKVMHFNSRGEIIQRSGEPKCPPVIQQQPPALQNPYPNPNVDIRVCMRFGCGSILKANMKDTAAPFCQMCIESGQVASDNSEGHLSSNPYSRLISTEKVKVPPIPFISHGLALPGDQAPGAKKNNIIVPSSIPMKTSPFTSQPLPVPPPLKYRVPSQHPTPHDPLPTQSRSHPPRPRQSASQPSQPPTRPVIKTCSTPGCNGIMHMQGASKRCHSCVMKEWKGKMKAMKAQSVTLEPPKAALTHSETTQQEDPTVTLGPGPTSLMLVTAEQAPPPDRATQPKVTITLPSIPASKSVLSPKLLDGTSSKPPQQSVMLRIPSKRKLADLPDSKDEAMPGKACSSASDEQSPPIRTPAPMVTETGPSIAAGQRPPAAAESSLLTPPPTSHLQQESASPKPPSSSQETAMDIDTPEPSGFTGWDSDLTSISDLEDSSDEESESERPRLVIRLPARSFSKHVVSSHDDKEGRNPPGTHYCVKEPTLALDGEGPRCVIKKCGVLLPEGYTWKLCRACRERNREYQRKRLGVTKGTYTIAKEGINPPKCDISPPQVATQNHASTSTARICVLKNCGEALPAMTDYPYKLCRDCRKRTTKTRRRRQLRAQGKEDAELDREIAMLRTRWRHRRTDRPATTSEQPEESSPRKISNAESRVSIYPEYPSLLPLVGEFGKRLGGFFDVHAVYIHHNPPSLSPKTQIQFGFDGEYSVVAMDADIMGRKEAIVDFVVRVKGELERVGGLQFDSRSMLVNFKHGGILTRFGGQQKVGHMVMQGELEIAILPEYSHPHFPGQRTVVRFRLVG